MQVVVRLIASFIVLTYIPIAYSKRELPSYLKICNRNDADLDKCVEQSIRNLQPYLSNGIDDMRLPPFDPLHVDAFVVGNDDVVFKMKNLDFHHFNEFDLKKAHLNWKKCYAKMDIMHPILTLIGEIEVKGSFLGLALDGLTGTVKANLTNVIMRPEMNCIVLRKKGREFVRFNQIDLGLKVGAASADINIFPDKEQNANFNNLIRINILTILEIFEPILSKALGEVVRGQVQSGFESFPLDILLPE